MGPLKQEFISPETRSYRFQIGRHIASSLSGFIAGVISASIVWYLIVYYLKIGL